MEPALRGALAEGVELKREQFYVVLSKLRDAVKKEHLYGFRLQVSNVLRRIFDERLDSSSKESEKGTEAEGEGEGEGKVEGDDLAAEVLNRFLQLSVQLAQRGIVHDSLPLELFADLFEARTVEQCKRYWELLEQKQEELLPISKLRGSMRSELFLLRLSNALLARLSRVVDTAFSGRIQMFLARLLPLEHRASLNVVGYFNTDKSTAFEGPKDDDDTAFAAAKDLLVGESLEAIEKGKPVDYDTYRTFWELQHNLTHPKKTVLSVDSWAAFRKKVHFLLGIFETHKAISKSMPSSNNDNGNRRHSMHGSGADSRSRDTSLGTATSTDIKAGGFGVKYLTKKTLLPLQLRDPHVQRHVLVQILVIAEYIGRHHTKIRGISKAITDPASDLRDLVKRAENLLKHVPPEGRKFLRFIRTQLEREQFWSKWKADKCEPFRKPAHEFSKPISAQKGFLQPLEADEEVEIFPGSHDMLLKDPLNLCRRTIPLQPSLDRILKRVRDANDPDNAIEDKFHPRRSAVYCWRGMRRLLASHMAVFEHHFQFLEDAVWQLDNPGAKKTGAPTYLKKAEAAREAAEKAANEAAEKSAKQAAEKAAKESDETAKTNNAVDSAAIETAKAANSTGGNNSPETTKTSDSAEQENSKRSKRKAEALEKPPSKLVRRTASNNESTGNDESTAKKGETNEEK